MVQSKTEDRDIKSENPRFTEPDEKFHYFAAVMMVLSAITLVAYVVTFIVEAITKSY